VWPWARLCSCLAGPTLRRLSGTALGCWPRAGAIRSAHRRDRHNRSRVRLRAIQSSRLHRNGISRADIRRRTMDRAIRQQPLAAQWCISGIRSRGLSRACRTGGFIEAVRNCASKYRSRYASASRPACSCSAASGPRGKGPQGPSGQGVRSVSLEVEIRRQILPRNATLIILLPELKELIRLEHVRPICTHRDETHAENQPRKQPDTPLVAFEYQFRDDLVRPTAFPKAKFQVTCFHQFGNHRSPSALDPASRLSLAEAFCTLQVRLTTPPRFLAVRSHAFR
jgi:hypothetical protein